MEFGLREVLILVGLVVIAGIAFDGFRRMRKSRMGELKLPTELGGSCEDDWEYFRGELPNGGARKAGMKGRRQEIDEDDLSQNDGDFGSAVDDSEFELPDDQVVTEARPARRAAKPRKVIDDADFGSHGELESSVTFPEREDTLPGEVSAARRATPEDARAAVEQSELFVDDDLLVASRADQQAQISRRSRGQAEVEKRAAPSRETPEVEIDPSLQEVLVINVMSRKREFDGADLLRVMLSCGFRFGDMNIFHRYEQHSGKGPLMFSAANVVEPGIFDLDRMSEFSTPGICIFMKLPGPKRPIHAFEIMMDSARKIATLLDGEVKDENHNLMRQQTAEHYRQRVLEFERKMLSFKASQKQV